MCIHLYSNVENKMHKICSYQLNIWYGFKWTPEY